MDTTFIKTYMTVLIVLLTFDLPMILYFNKQMYQDQLDTINEDDMVYHMDLHTWPSCQSSLKDILINNLPENPEDPLPVALKLPKVYTEILRYKYIRLVEFDEEIINDIYLTYDLYQKGGSYDKFIKYKTKLSLLSHTNILTL